MSNAIDLLYYYTNPSLIYSVYGIWDDCGNLTYIGCTKRNLRERLYDHQYTARKKNDNKRLKSFHKIKIIKSFDNPFEASLFEAKLISKRLTTFNRGNCNYAPKYDIKWFIEKEKIGGRDLVNRLLAKRLKHYNSLSKRFEKNIINYEDRHLILEVAKKQAS